VVVGAAMEARSAPGTIPGAFNGGTAPASGSGQQSAGIQGRKGAASLSVSTSRLTPSMLARCAMGQGQHADIHFSALIQLLQCGRAQAKRPRQVRRRSPSPWWHSSPRRH